ncbi:bifunctional protein-serine/threonine kinase/phosphatase [Vibrio sp. ZSDE26]|uniref:non-specific serine/threonine protein kinase n=1 Tax=Vibrio amylolyticus TaxID=2847292 RepID=A0A9X1XTT9_9VIBR|nr:bifunctional protein-serine/threonine kinase/phosphatase [Vibrio amylolyticus]MCK6265449.1 bifunctional protein-serine/threonine kinase/phosphatase [Vibrio amylolyticus]
MGINNIKTKASLCVEFGGTSLTGLRDENQDAFLVKSPTLPSELEHKGIVACIADGVSCSEQGQKASHTATMQFITDYYATPDTWSVKHSASKIVSALNSWLFSQGQKQSLNHNGLVTTLSTIVFKSNTAHLFHIGDSRIYRLRDGKLRMLTRDHQRTNFGKGSYLTRALGIDNQLEVDYQTVTLQVNDRFLLTTDGVHDFLSQSEFHQLAQSKLSSREAISNDFCQQALANSSHDNLSCLIIDIKQLPEQSLFEHQKLLLKKAIPPAMRVNNKIDNFIVDRVLYSGPRSHVYLVHDEKTYQTFVLKAPSLNYVDDHDVLSQFANEYWVGCQLNNERIMQVFPTPIHSKFCYQLCEHIDGITLRQWMYDNPAPSIDTVRALVSEMIKAIRVLQRAEMVHRDLKPENIMILNDGNIKLIDFGSIKVSSLEDGSTTAKESIPLGDVNYAATEYIENGTSSLSSDLFSIAVIGYEMLCGKRPYKAINGQTVQSARHHDWRYQTLRTHRQEIPIWFDLSLQKACHPSPSHRYQVLSEFVHDLYTPNPKLLKAAQLQPLIKRNPTLFWKGAAIFFVLLSAIEFFLLLDR